MTFLEIYVVGLLVILAAMTALWLLSLAPKNSSIVDPLWGPGFVLVNWVYFALTDDGFGGRKWLISALVTVWGLRLGLYLLARNWGKGEDFRYARWREQAGDAWWWRSYFKVFVLQGVILWVVSAPLLAAQFAAAPARLTVIDALAVPVWAVGFFFEAVGDWQLARFKANPANKGKVLNTGVWRYTRHPNYFGDAAQWWGFWLVAAAAEYGFLTVFSPAIMTFFLLRVSGVAMLERDIEERRPGYKAYIETTSAFIPMPPRRKPQA
jgi:steroid 5-alpha reductase family enzyme